MEPAVIHVLTGETAVGKTELALAWAAAHDAEIVSCDSTLFYRGMDIGTAKPTRAELARVPHHLIDIRPVDQPLDITVYVELARAAVRDILARGRRVLVTGGSGFYLKAFFAPVADNVTVPAELRAEVNASLETHGLPALVARLGALNPHGLGALDTANPRRVTRALERCLASGRTLAELAADFAAQPGPFAGHPVLCTRLTRPVDELAVRIGQRVALMLSAGLVDEVRALRAAGLERNPGAARAIGYRETLAMLDGALPKADLAAEIVKNTKALARKQRTWFRTQIPPHRELPAAQARVGALF
ncbi:MAG: tRNA (adenosine(37)-N6)-dimethylallyltransferase MiaA [Verrucomicrobiota bacterium]